MPSTNVVHPSKRLPSPDASSTPPDPGPGRLHAVGAFFTSARFWLPVGTLVVVLAAWQYLPGMLNVKPFIFPKLSSVVEKFTSTDTRQVLFEHLHFTLYEALVGLFFGVVAGVVTGFVLGEFALLRSAFYPYLIALQSLPKVAVAPLFVIWFGFGLTPKILIVALLCFFPMLVNTMTGVMNVDQTRLDLFRSLCASRLQIWGRLLLPTSLPSIFAGLEVAVVFSLLGAIVGEFVSAEAGLGLVLQQYQNNYDTAGVFAVLLILSACGVVLNQTVAFARRRILFWQQKRS